MPDPIVVDDEPNKTRAEPTPVPGHCPWCGVELLASTLAERMTEWIDHVVVCPVGRESRHSTNVARRRKRAPRVRTDR